MPGIMSRTTGRIASIEEATGTFAVESEHGDFVVVSPTGCTFGYGANMSLPDKIAALLPKGWDSLLYLTFPNDIKLVIFAI